MSKTYRNLSLLLALAFVLAIASGPVRADSSQSAAPDFQGPKLLPDCKAAFDLSPSARRAVGDAVLTFQAIILKDGSVGFVELLNDDRPYPGIEQAARQSLRNWRYEPGKLGGVPVNAGVTITVQFRGSAVGSMTQPAQGWSSRELGPVLPPLDRIVFDGSEPNYFPQSQTQDAGLNTAGGFASTCSMRAGPRCAYVPMGGPFYAVDMPIASADRMGR